MMVTDDIAYAEVFELLSYMNRETVMKIPVELLQFFKEKRNSEYISRINPNNIFNKDNISDEARVILAWIDLEYFSTTDEEKKNKIALYKNNEQEQINKEMYNSKELFDKNTKKIKDLSEDINKSSISLAECKKTNIFSKIFAKLKKILNIRK